jgi:hypothetical protein
VALGSAVAVVTGFAGRATQSALERGWRPVLVDAVHAGDRVSIYGVVVLVDAVAVDVAGVWLDVTPNNGEPRRVRLTPSALLWRQEVAS